MSEQKMSALEFYSKWSNIEGRTEAKMDDWPFRLAEAYLAYHQEMPRRPEWEQNAEIRELKDENVRLRGLALELNRPEWDFDIPRDNRFHNPLAGRAAEPVLESCPRCGGSGHGGKEFGLCGACAGKGEVVTLAGREGEREPNPIDRCTECGNTRDHMIHCDLEFRDGQGRIRYHEFVAPANPEREHKPSCKSKIRSVYSLSQPCDCGTANPGEREADTEHGMSSEELGAQFPKFFRPAEPEEVGERDEKPKRKIGGMYEAEAFFPERVCLWVKFCESTDLGAFKVTQQANPPVRDERLEFEKWWNDNFLRVPDPDDAAWAGWLARSERVKGEK